MSLTITLLAAVRASEIGPSACYGVFARSFRERKLEFLSAQHVKLGFQVVLRENYPVLFAQNYQNKQKELGALPRAHFHGSTTRGHSKAPVPTTVGPADKGRDCRWLASVCVSEAALRAIGAGAGRVLRGSPDVPKCGQVAPTAVGRRCAAGLGRARPGDSSY